MSNQSLYRLLEWISVVTAVLILSYCPAVADLHSPNSHRSYPSSASLDASMSDGTYVANSQADNDLISYRLVITFSNKHISSADFRLLYDGFDWHSGIAPYIEQWLIDPPGHSTFVTNAATYEVNAAAAIAYNTQLVGLRNPNQLPTPPPGSNFTSVYASLLNSWNRLVELKLLLVEKRQCNNPWHQ